MNRAIYIGITIALYMVEIWLSIIVEDIGNIFGFIGTIAGTSLSFFVPSVLYCRAYNKFAKNGDSKTLFYVAIFNFGVGVFLFGLFLYSNIISLKKD